MMFYTEFWFLFVHVFMSLKFLWDLVNQPDFRILFSPILWKILVGFQIFLIFVILQMDISVLFFKSLFLYAPLAFSFLLQSFLFISWKKAFYGQFEFFLNTLVAQIKIGMGFRSAFKASVDSLPSPRFKKYFMDILEMILFSKKLRQELYFSPLKEMLRELVKADQSNRALEHLENLRHQVRVRAQFQKKVQSVLLQLRAQSIVLVVLYVGLFAFVLQRYGLKHLKILMLSFALFTVGLVIMFRCGRRVKWTI